MVFLSYHYLLILRAGPAERVFYSKKRYRLTDYACESSSPFNAKYCPLSLWISVHVNTTSILSFEDKLSKI